MNEAADGEPQEDQTRQKCNCCECVGAIWRKFKSGAAWPFQDPHKLAATATLILALGTLALAALGFQQVRLMKNDQRPWIGLSAIHHNEEGQGVFAQVIDYQVNIANGGKSPALKAYIIMTGGPGDCSKYQFPTQRCEADQCTFRGIEMLPGTSKGMRIPNVEKTRETPLIGPNFEACFIIRADYEDTDGGTHKTGICMVFSRLASRTCPDPDTNFAD
jgi:hypothetical protein